MSRLSQKLDFIVIEGNIGAGKTSLCNKIAKDYNARVMLEQFADNPFLPKFYKAPDKYSFQLELAFLADRFYRLKNDLMDRNLFKSFAISDYYFSKSLIFAKNTLSGDEYALYRKIFDIIYTSLPQPDLYVYLHLSPEKSIENIQKRGRQYEQDIQIEYLEKIQKAYFDYFKQQTNFKFLIIDTNNIDFVNKTTDYQKLKKSIFETNYPTGLNRIIL